MRVYPLKDGNFYVNKNKDFYDLAGSENFRGLKIAVQPFLIETAEDLVLLDAGLGWLTDGVPNIHQHIQSIGFEPDDIDRILLSHLHKDHIEGLVNKAKEGWKLNFPDAEIYLQKREYEYAMSKPTSPSLDLVLLQFIVDNAKIIWMNEDEGVLSPYIRYQVTGGHTPFHQVFWIEENGEIAFYGADNLPQKSYLDIHIAYKSDYDGKKAMEERLKWEQEAKGNNWKILLYHDMENAVITL